jgi:hypothetical protein
MGIAADVTVPPRSRTFTQDDARNVLALLNGEAEGQEAPAKNVGFGEFNTAGAARSAGVTLNRLLTDLGAPHKYAVTTFQRDEKFVGVLLNKPAKERTAAEAAAEDAPAETTPRRRRRNA